jgi:hypothetical protein
VRERDIPFWGGQEPVSQRALSAISSLKAAGTGVVLASFLSLDAAHAGIINEPPCLCASQQVAANDPAHSNVWTGVAQSFTAQDPNILFGFYMFTSTPSESDPVLFSLYSGDGNFSAPPLDQVAATVPSNAIPFDISLVQVDFSSINLTSSDVYTVAVTLPSEGLPTLGTNSDANITYAGLNNPYPGGRFYFVGASFDESLPTFADRDIAFNVTPVPEPASATLLLGPLLVLLGWRTGPTIQHLVFRRGATHLPAAA